MGIVCPATRLKIPDWTDWAIETRFAGLPDLNPLFVSLSRRFYDLPATQTVEHLSNALWPCSIWYSVSKEFNSTPPGGLCVAISRRLLGVRDFWAHCVIQKTYLWLRMLVAIFSEEKIGLKICDRCTDHLADFVSCFWENYSSNLQKQQRVG